MTNQAADVQPPDSPASPGAPAVVDFWRRTRLRLVEGVLVLLPIVVTFWIVYWVYSVLFTYAIEPLAMLVLWKGRTLQG
ncbi:MAG: hypothetical protein ACRC1K_09545, partial [Planctomycetia bacterium]